MIRKNFMAGFKAWFTCTRAEKNAALLLSGVLLLFQVYVCYRHYSIGQIPITPDAEVVQAAGQLREYAYHAPSGRHKKEAGNAFGSKTRSAHLLQPFDPNQLDSAGFVSIGLSPKQASSVIRYRERIGKFGTKEDVARVRVIPPQLFNRWEPYIRIREGERTQPAIIQGREEAAERKLSLIDLNLSDSLTLMDLPMIGSGRARAIISYRERLGGYIRVEQLREVRAIPDSVYMVISKRVTCDTLPYRKLEINRLPSDSLRHPYLPKQLARMIVSYREQHGPFLKVEDLARLPLADAEILLKLAPYISLKP